MNALSITFFFKSSFTLVKALWIDMNQTNSSVLYCIITVLKNITLFF